MFKLSWDENSRLWLVLHNLLLYTTPNTQCTVYIYPHVNFILNVDGGTYKTTKNLYERFLHHPPSTFFFNIAWQQACSPSAFCPHLGMERGNTAQWLEGGEPPILGMIDLHTWWRTWEKYRFLSAYIIGLAGHLFTIKSITCNFSVLRWGSKAWRIKRKLVACKKNKKF